MYEGDSPLAERRAAALSVDPSLLAELLGQPELRDLFDAEALADLEAELQHLSPDRHARDVEDAADLLRLLGPLTLDQALARGVEPAWLTMLERSRRAIRVRIAGEERWAAIEDAGRLRDGLGCPLPVGVPEAFTEPVPDPLGDLIARYARTHAPFTAHQVAGHFGLGVAVCTGMLERLAAERRVVRGAFRPDGSGEEWCDARVLRRLRRRTVAALRKQAEPVAPVALARLLPIWQSVGPADVGPGRRARGTDIGGDGEAWAQDWRAGTVTDPDYGSMRMGRTADWRTGGGVGAAGGMGVGGVFGARQGISGNSGSARRAPDRRMRGVDGVLRAVEQMAGVPVPASALERLILPSRVSDYQPAMLDELTSSGEVVWAGAGALAVDDGWVALAPAAIAPLILPEPVAPIDLGSEPYRSILAALDGDAALFFRALASQVSGVEAGTAGRARRDGGGAGAAEAGTFGHARQDGAGAPGVNPGAPETGTRGRRARRDGGGAEAAEAGAFERARRDGGGAEAAEAGTSGRARRDGAEPSSADPGSLEAGTRGRRDAADEFGSGASGGATSTAGNDPAPILSALWELVWAGLVTNDTYAPIRALLTSGRTAHRAKRPTPRGRYSSLRFAAAAASAADPILPSAVAATAVGRWSRLRLADPEADPRLRATAAQIMGEVLLDRYGIVTRGSVGAERLPRELGRGFSAVYRVLSAFEDAGRCRRGYFVEGLGAAQFAADGAIDRLRALAGDGQEPEWRSPADVDGANGLGGAGANPVSADVDSANARADAGAVAGTNPDSADGEGVNVRADAGGVAGTNPVPVDGANPRADVGAGANPVSADVDGVNALVDAVGVTGTGRVAGTNPDWLRDPRVGRSRREGPTALLLAAADPANAYGAAIAWPERPGGGGHKPGRKAGALVVLVDGELVLYVERGGRTVLSWSESTERLGMAARAVVDAVQAGRVGALTVTSTDSVPVLAAGSGSAPTPVAAALIAAGFSTSPQGLRMRP
jgi:ATP-dependent Lhr-like helicase